MSSTPTRRRFGNWLLLLFSTMLALAVMEGAVRLFDLPPRPLEALPIQQYRLATEPVLRYEYRPYPGIIRRVHAGLTSNSQGFRDYEYTVQKAEGVRRLVVLGDSTTVGRGVENFADIYPKRLELALNGGDAAQSHGWGYEVLSLAVGGYQTLQEVETLRHKGLRYEPDAVLLTFCVNDYNLSSDGGIFDKLWQYRHLTLGSVPETPPWLRWLRRSRLAFLVRHRLRAPLSEQDRLYAERFLGQRSTVRAGFELLSELQQEHGFPVLVVILPELRRPFDQYASSEIHQRVVDDAAGLPGLTVVDLLPYFAATGLAPNQLRRDAIHLNALGHEVLADILLPFIQLESGGDLDFRASLTVEGREAEDSNVASGEATDALQ